MRLAVVLLVAALLPLAGCPGPTIGQVADQFAPKVGARHAELKKVVAGLPAAGSLSAPTAATGLTPAPEYRRKDQVYTLDIVQVEHVDDPTVDIRLAGKLDLLSSEVLVAALRDVAPGHLKEDDRARSSYETYPRRFERALALPWVALVRTVEYVKPEAVSETEFKAGHAKLEVFLVDAQAGAVKASFPVEARSKTDVRYEYRKGDDDPKERLAAFARSTLWEDAREKIAAGLKQHAGATVSLD